MLARATSPDPATRYESAAEMAEALREAGRSYAGVSTRKGVGTTTGQVATYRLSADHAAGVKAPSVLNPSPSPRASPVSANSTVRRIAEPKPSASKTEPT